MERKVIVKTGLTDDASIDYLLAMFDDARATTLQRISDLSVEELHWQYDEGWNSISVLLEHIISCSHYFRIWLFEKREFTEEEEKVVKPGKEMGKYIPELIAKNKGLDYYIAELAVSRKQMNEAISKLTKEEFFERIEGYSEETGTNLAWVLYHVVEDEVHHRGQISMIRKLFKARNN